MAIRPRTLSAAAAPVLIGTGYAAWRGALAPLPAAAALVGALLIQIATNLANDYYDFVRGSDTEARVGPTRVTQAGLVEPERVRRVMLGVLAAAFLVGVYLVGVGGWPIVWVGLASLVCAVAYTGGPFPLAYHGLGDLFVFVFFGLVAVGGTVWVQALALPADALWAGAGIGALNTMILVANNLRDIDTDRAAGKRTLAVRLGRHGTRAEYVLLLAFALAVPLVGVARFAWPPTTLLAAAALVSARDPLVRVLRADDPRALIPALGGTARVVTLYGGLLALGFVLGGR
ncbi:MAG: 1,4-dihydroxy-2-naphthoate polyprenyltransferase [Gemmatimonadetes bacterium]|nr:MAG: 1,4-dihydroxy-2-naphthoate polyprenyltransferase [Gemmatimonadota bacterium]